MSEKIVRDIGGCEVTITFKGHNDEDVKDKVMWLLLESYCERINEPLYQEITPLKKVS